ncbi:MAG: VOC family protein [Bacteroidota bacterium]|nr:VOC family protein [Bacteroidota bacterium]MDP4231357.1 VOC family protein [Bacteroidota bacterium]MDP4237455.1 VOC family protein [Bacteroidota bacterium]
MNPVIHFEMPAEDRKRMSNFYSQVFGWQTQILGEEMGGYVLATTAESDEKGVSKTPGSINGGFYQKTEDPSSNAPSIVIQVPDVKEHMKKVIAGGGKILSEPMDIPGVGRWVSFQDTEGNRVSMLQSLS